MGWERGTTYRVRLTSSLLDVLGRAPAGQPALEIPIPADGSPISWARTFPVSFETFLAAGETANDLIPGGQSILWEGAWTSSLGGHQLKRARVYDPRTASFLSEDPLDDVDSPNLYGYVAGRPHEATDPWGLSERTMEMKDQSCAVTGIGCPATHDANAIWNSQVVQGSLESFGGAVPLGFRIGAWASPQPLTKVAAVVAAVRGFDHMLAGWRSIWTRKPSAPMSDVLLSRAAGRAGPAVGMGLDALSMAAIARATSTIPKTGVAVESTTPQVLRFSGQVDYGTTDLSRMAIAYRRAEGHAGGNVAVFEYIDQAGETSYFFGRSRGPGLQHAENVVVGIMEKQGLDLRRVSRVYTELSPCTVPRHQCAGLLASKTPNAAVTYSFRHPEDVKSLLQAVKGQGVSRTRQPDAAPLEDLEP